MKSEEISNELKELEQKMASLRSQMDNLYCEIQDAMPAAAASWMNQELERIIKDNAEVVQSLGIKRLKVLKSKFKALTEELPKKVAEEFHDRSRWEHHIEWKQESDEPVRRINVGIKERYLDRIFRNVISHLGALLYEFGLITEPKGRVASWEHVGQNRFRYAINPGTKNLPQSKLAQYSSLFKDYISLSENINLTRKSLSEAKAKELWDQA